MKYKEPKKQQFYMRNVYINQIMKPQIQNNLNYAYFGNPRNLGGYCDNQTLELNRKNIAFNNKPIKTFYQNYIPNKHKSKKETFSFMKNVYENNDNFYQKNIGEFNDSSLLEKNYKNEENPINDRNNSENRTINFNYNNTDLNKNQKNDDDYSYLRVNKSNRNSNKTNGSKNIKYYEIQNKNIDNNSTKNTNNSSRRSYFNRNKDYYNERNKNKNIKIDKNTYFSDYNNKIPFNQINKIISFNNDFTISTNTNNNSYNNKINYKNSQYSNSNNNDNTGKGHIKSYKYYSHNKNICCKSVDKSPSRNDINYIKNKNNSNSSNRNEDAFKNIENISILNSPSVPSCSSIIEDNSVNSKKYVWIKKNIKNNRILNNINNNKYSTNFYKKPNTLVNNINKNLLNFSDEITNMNTSLYKNELYYPDFLCKEIKLDETKKLFENSATLIQSIFRGYLVKKKFDIQYYNYKYYYNKGIEILELILNYFFNKNTDLIEEKQKFFNYLLAIKNMESIINKKRKNKINQKPKSYQNFKQLNSVLSPNNCNIKMKKNKYYQDFFLHKETRERFNIITSNNKEKDIEKKYKDKLEGINLKLNKLINENNVLKDINQKNIIKESKYREMSKDNKKKDDIINIITNDNKTLAKKLKIIQDKFNKLQIQNQDYINYNLDDEQMNKNKNDGIDLFEEYRNLFLQFLIHKTHEKYYLSVLRNYLNKFKNITFALKTNDKANEKLKKQKLKYLYNNTNNQNNNYLYNNLIKFKYKSIIYQKELENKTNLIKYKLLNIFKNKEKAYKSYLRAYFYKFYYQGIICNIKQEKNKRIINIRKEDYKKIKKFLNSLLKRRDRYFNNIKREYFMKWHLYTKVLGLKALINDKRRKKRQKQKLKKKNETETSNKYLTNNKILHFGKSNIYILNKDKEKELLISLDNKNEEYLSMNKNINDNNNKYNNVIQATEKLGEIFYRAAKSRALFERIEKEDKNNNEKDNINNNIEEEEDSGDSFGV